MNETLGAIDEEEAESQATEQARNSSEEELPAIKKRERKHFDNKETDRRIKRIALDQVWRYEEVQQANE